MTTYICMYVWVSNLFTKCVCVYLQRNVYWVQTTLCGKQIPQILIIFLFINAIINWSLQHFHTPGAMGQWLMVGGCSPLTADDWCLVAVTAMLVQVVGWIWIFFFWQCLIKYDPRTRWGAPDRQLTLWFALLRSGAQPDVVRLNQGIFVLGSGHKRM